MQISIDDSLLNGFNSEAKRRLESVLESYSKDVIAESLRLESGHNSIGTQPEVTSSMVTSADRAFRMGTLKKKSYLGLGSALLAAPCWAVVGNLIDAAKIKTNLDIVILIFFLIVGIAASAFSYVKE